jgi:hypothetical protein
LTVGNAVSSIYYLRGIEIWKAGCPMVIRPVLQGEAEDPSAAPVSAWQIVEQTQHSKTGDYWLIPQPAHAALAGDMAAKLRPELFGPIDPVIARCIALHDAGWSAADAAAIQALRSPKGDKTPLLSFLDVEPAEAVKAWTASIETTEKFAPIGGYLVSCHFTRLAETYGKDRPGAQPFVARERRRQQRISHTLKETKDQLDRWVNALQFCDLLSLYLCCGARRKALIAIGGVSVEISSANGEYMLSPSPFTGPQQFNFPALSLSGVPKTKASGAGAPVSPREGNAIFYINL